MDMKRIAIIFLALILGLCLATGAVAADKDAIKKQVDEIVVAIDGGKKAEDFMAAARTLLCIYNGAGWNALGASLISWAKP